MALLKIGNSRFHGQVRFDNNGPVDVPATLTAEITVDCFVTKVEITNQSGALRTVSAQDGNGIYLIPPHALNNNEIITYTDSDGRRMPGGVQWQAGAAGCKGYISGFIL